MMSPSAVRSRLARINTRAVLQPEHDELVDAKGSHDPDITEDHDGFWHAACTCGWAELAGHADRQIAVWDHDDHLAELIDHGVTG